MIVQGSFHPYTSLPFKAIQPIGSTRPLLRKRGNAAEPLFILFVYRNNGPLLTRSTTIETNLGLATD